MKKKEKLANLIESNNGYLSIAEAVALGISKPYIHEYLNENGFECVAHGLYKSPDVWRDDLYILSLKNTKAIFSLDTALMLNGLTEREPDNIFVTVSRAYNASHLRGAGVIVNYVREDLLNLGRTVAKTTYGNTVAVYDMEKTICDIIRLKNRKDPQFFAYALKEYAKISNKDLLKLAWYAKKLGIESKLRMYMEVLL